MRDAYKRRPEDFKRRILETVSTTRDDLYEREFRWLAFIPNNQLGKRYYNLKKDRHTGVFDGKTKSERISNSLKGKKHEPEHTAQRAISIKKTMSTPEKKLELSIQAKAMWSREGHTEHMSAKMSEIWTTEEHRAKTIPNIVATLNSEETVKKFPKSLNKCGKIQHIDNFNQKNDLAYRKVLDQKKQKNLID